MQVTIRSGDEGDLPELVRIYNHYVETSPATFDLAPYSVESRRAWLEGHSGTERNRMFVAETGERGPGDRPRLAGYACSGRFRDKAAYDPSVEASVYVAPEALGQGVGRALYEALVPRLRDEPSVHRVLAGITLPNEASVALHERFGFVRIGTFSEVGFKFGRYWDVGWWELDVGRGGA